MFICLLSGTMRAYPYGREMRSVSKAEKSQKSYPPPAPLYKMFYSLLWRAVFFPPYSDFSNSIQVIRFWEAALQTNLEICHKDVNYSHIHIFHWLYIFDVVKSFLNFLITFLSQISSPWSLFSCTCKSSVVLLFSVESFHSDMFIKHMKSFAENSLWNWFYI